MNRNMKNYVTVLVGLSILAVFVSTAYYFSTSTNTDTTIEQRGQQLETVETEIIQVFDNDLKPVEWNANLTQDSSLRFTFEGRSINQNYTVGGFNCKLDNDAPFMCTSPFTLYDADATNGTHTFEVFAEDNEGNDDLTPAVFMWRVP